MSFSLVPQYSFREIMSVTPEFLNQLGVRFLMVDLDNTIAAYSEHSPSDEISRWASEIRGSGVKLYIVSNSRRDGRVGSFAEALGLDFIMQASKPSPKGVMQAMGVAGYSAHESALAGDQIYTDTLAANRAGVISIIVRPKRFTNPLLALRYAVEAPFRALCRNRG